MITAITLRQHPLAIQIKRRVSSGYSRKCTTEILLLLVLAPFESSSVKAEVEGSVAVVARGGENRRQQ